MYYFKIDTFEENRYQIDTKFGKKYLYQIWEKVSIRYQNMNLAAEYQNVQEWGTMGFNWILGNLRAPRE